LPKRQRQDTIKILTFCFPLKIIAFKLRFRVLVAIQQILLVEVREQVSELPSIVEIVFRAPMLQMLSSLLAYFSVFPSVQLHPKMNKN
jgi:hypothetical protein